MENSSENDLMERGESRITSIVENATDVGFEVALDTRKFSTATTAEDSKSIGRSAQ